MPEMVDENEVAYKLLGILQSYAPDGQAQADLAGTYNQMDADGLHPRQKVAVLSGMLLDGVNLGNWPWSRGD